MHFALGEDSCILSFLPSLSDVVFSVPPSSLIFLKDTPWNAHDPAGHFAVGISCFTCADAIGRIRPGMVPEEAKKVLETRPCPDGALKADLQKAQSILIEGADSNIMPLSDVHTQKGYDYMIYQEFAILTESEHFKLTGISVKDAGSKAKAWDINWLGPNSKTQFWILGLEGLTSEQISAVRKVRIAFHDGVTFNSNFLAPSENLIPSQGSRVFEHIVDKKMAARPGTLRGNFTSVPDSVADLKAKANEMEPDEEEVEAALATARVEGEDDMDEFLDEDEADGQAAPAMPSRTAGIDLSLLEDAKPNKRPKAKAAKTGKGEKGGTSASGVSTQAPDDGDTGTVASKPSSKSKLLAASEGLDPDLQFVAQKHLATSSGSSIKSLEGLEPHHFLLASQSEERTLSSKLRGVRNSETFS